MSGTARTFYAACASFAGWLAKRRMKTADKWLSRSERWSALAKGRAA